MADTPAPAPRPSESALAREARNLADRAESLAIGFFVVGVVLLVIGLGLALFRGSGLVCLILGGISFLTGGIQGVRAEVLRVRAKMEKD